MKAHLSSIERSILTVLQEGFPDSRSPYKDMAQKAGIGTGQLLAVLKNWWRQGKLRRIGAIVNPIKAGSGAGALVVWQVQPERIEQAGQILAEFKEVSHAYERETSKNWPYNVYTMVHGASAGDVQQVVRRMSRACGVSSYRVLVTEKELKKAPPVYVIPQK